MTTGLIITGNRIGPKMAGPATYSVTLATTAPLDGTPGDQFELKRLVVGDECHFSALESRADVIIFRGMHSSSSPGSGASKSGSC